MNHRDRLVRVFRGAVAACDPARRVAAMLDESGSISSAMDAVTVIAMGKAAPAMADGACRALGGRVRGGIVVAPDGVVVPDRVPDRVHERLDVRRAAHPIPDARSEVAGRQVRARASALDATRDVLLVLVSGGASSLCAVPRDGVTLAEKIARTGEAMRAGAPIAELNALRTSLSALKGGKLAAACPARVITLVASDVPGDDLAVVGSGPTIPGKPGDVAALAAGLVTLRDAAGDAARAEGFAVHVHPIDLIGDIATVADTVVEAHPLGLWIGGGEWTVSLGATHGIGGRATELALRLARAWDGRDDVAALVAGSDGVDGTGPAAGAHVDGATWRAISAAGIDPARALATHDSGRALAAIGATVITGPTGVNHADLILIADLSRGGAPR